MEELENLILNYRPGKSAIELVEKTNIVLLVGITGAGKDTIKNEILKQNNFCEIVSHTTRSPRMNGSVQELDGVDYNFVDLGTAIEMLKKQQFVEAKIVHGNIIYGTSISEVQKIYDEKKTAIADVDVQGADYYNSISNKVTIIFILPPNYDVWQQRLHNRYAKIDEFNLEWPKRRQSAVREINSALNSGYYHFVINDDLNQAVNDVFDIIDNKDNSSASEAKAKMIAHHILEEIQSLSDSENV